MPLPLLDDSDSRSGPNSALKKMSVRGHQEKSKRDPLPPLSAELSVVTEGDAHVAEIRDRV